MTNTSASIPAKLGVPVHSRFGGGFAVESGSVSVEMGLLSVHLSFQGEKTRADVSVSPEQLPTLIAQLQAAARRHPEYRAALSRKLEEVMA